MDENEELASTDEDIQFAIIERGVLNVVKEEL
jgi:hypothetical protein